MLSELLDTERKYVADLQQVIRLSVLLVSILTNSIFGF